MRHDGVGSDSWTHAGAEVLFKLGRGIRRGELPAGGLGLGDVEVFEPGRIVQPGVAVVHFHPRQQLTRPTLGSNLDFGVVLGFAINLRFPFSLVIILAVLWGRPETC